MNDNMREQVNQLRQERDVALHLAENRRDALVRRHAHAGAREDHLMNQVGELLVEVHRLRTMVLPPEVGPQVIVAEDNGENASAPVPTPAPTLMQIEDEELEVEPNSDPEDGMIFDADSEEEEV